MVRPKSNHPTELELLILKVLWDNSPLAVRDVRDALELAGRNLAHTTVITTLNVMVKKRFLQRSKDGKSFLFSPKVTREQVSGQMLGDVVDRVFDGSAKAVMLTLFESADLDAEELAELRQLLERKTKGQSK